MHRAKKHYIQSWGNWQQKGTQQAPLALLHRELFVTPGVSCEDNPLYTVLRVSTSKWVKSSHSFQDLLMVGAHKRPLMVSFKFIRLFVPTVLVPVAPLLGSLGSPTGLSHDDLHCKYAHTLTSTTRRSSLSPWPAELRKSGIEADFSLRNRQNKQKQGWSFCLQTSDVVCLSASIKIPID